MHTKSNTYYLSNNFRNLSEQDIWDIYISTVLLYSVIQLNDEFVIQRRHLMNANDRNKYFEMEFNKHNGYINMCKQFELKKTINAIEFYKNKDYHSIIINQNKQFIEYYNSIDYETSSSFNIMNDNGKLLFDLNNKLNKFIN